MSLAAQPSGLVATGDTGIHGTDWPVVAVIVSGDARHFRPRSTLAYHLIDPYHFEIDLNITHSDGVWTVPLGESHVAYPFMRLHRRFEKLREYTVVIVDTARLMECFTRDTIGIPPAVDWPITQLEHHREYLNPKRGTPEMPIVHCRENTYVRQRLWGLLSPLREILPVVTFTNGRHRTRYMEYAGAMTIPVETDLASAPLLRHYCAVPHIATVSNAFDFR